MEEFIDIISQICLIVLPFAIIFLIMFGILYFRARSKSFKLERDNLKLHNEVEDLQKRLSRYKISMSVDTYYRAGVVPKEDVPIFFHVIEDGKISCYSGWYADDGWYADLGACFQSLDTKLKKFPSYLIVKWGYIGWLRTTPPGDKQDA